MKARFGFLARAAAATTVVAAASAGVASGAEHARISVVLDSQRKLAGELPALEVTADSESGHWTGARPAGSDSQLVATLKPGRLWTFSVRGDGIWAPERTVFIQPQNTEVVLPVWPAGLVAGKLSWSKNNAPERLDIWLWPSGEHEAGKAAFGPLECALQGTAFQCPLPQGLWDLKLRAPSHISFLYWAKTVGEVPIELGTLRLVRGASILGWVETAQGPAAGTGCSVDLTPFESNLDDSEARRLQRATAKATSNERGFFKFEGVAPGRYIVTATKQGYAPARAFPVDVLENAETTIPGTIVLHPPVRIEVELIPPLDPLERPWQVSLYEWGRMAKFKTNRRPMVSDEPADAGTWASPPLAPGEYSIRLSTSWGSTWDYREITLGPTSKFVQIITDVVPVRGTVTLGENPIAARVAFVRDADEEGGTGGSTINTQANLDGEFECDLPAEGMWTVQVFSKAPLVQRRLPDVRVSRLGGAPTAHVDIALPDLRVEGRVIDDSDEGVPHAVVTIRNLVHQEALAAETDDQGRFALHALAEGLYSAHAGDGGRQSDRVEFEVEKDRPTPALVLQLREDLTVRGRVVDSSGRGLPGASVFWMTATATSNSPATTGLDGDFEARIPRGAGTVLFHVLAPGYALHGERWNGQRKGFALRLTQFGGTVVLHGTGAVTASGRFPALFHDGLLIPWLVGWAGIHGSAQPIDPEGPWSIPMLEPGVYAACSVTMSDLPAAIESAATGFAADCDSGTLSPGNILELDLQ